MPSGRRPAPLLVIAVGNPSRGDDALGPLFAERLGVSLAAEIARGEVEVFTDFQLQIEHALDLVGRERVVFVDASVRAAPPFEHARIEARREAQVSTHAMSPQAVLQTYQSALGGEALDAWVLGIRGEQFELGEGLSEGALGHLDAAVGFFLASLAPMTALAREPPPPESPARAAGDGAAPVVGRRIEVDGVVQGVGFRPWVYRTARGLGLSGVVRNTRRGVTIEAYGSAASLDALVRATQEQPPGSARIRAVRITPLRGRRQISSASPSRRATRGARSAPRWCSRPTSRPATRACATSTMRPIGTTGTRSRAAPTAARASASRSACPTTARPPRWRPSRHARPARASTRTLRRSPLPRADHRVPRVWPEGVAREPDRRPFAGARRPRGRRVPAESREDPRSAGARGVPPRLRRDERRRRGRSCGVASAATRSPSRSWCRTVRGGASRCWTTARPVRWRPPRDPSSSRPRGADRDRPRGERSLQAAPA